MRVRPSKTGRERTVPVTPEGLAALGAYLRLERPRTVPHDVVFVNLGRRGFGQPFRYRSWVAICEQARTAAGTPRVHAHAFRHTCATNLAEAGMPLDALRQQLGHAHLQTTMLYDDIRPERVRREFDEATAVLEADRRLRQQAERGEGAR
jgi:integrase/recombinase XerD